jgi:hypothetical protein
MNISPGQGKQIRCESHSEVMITADQKKTVKPGVAARLTSADIKCKFRAMDWGANKGYCSFGGEKTDCCYD